MTTSYQKIRGQIESGDLILTEGANFFSRIIQMGTRSSFAHTALAVKVPMGKNKDDFAMMVIESIPNGGVNTHALSHMGNFVWVPTKTTRDQRRLFHKHVIAHSGRINYSAGGIWLQIKKIFTELFNPHGEVNQDRWLAADKSICSRYSSWHAAKSFGRDDAPIAPDPGDLFMWWQANLLDEKRSQGPVWVTNPMPEPIDLRRA